jgi:hypothetical protein
MRDKIGSFEGVLAAAQARSARHARQVARFAGLLATAAPADHCASYTAFMVTAANNSRLVSQTTEFADVCRNRSNGVCLAPPARAKLSEGFAGARGVPHLRTIDA